MLRKGSTPRHSSGAGSITFTILQSHRRLAPQVPLPEATSCIAQVHTLQAFPARTTIYRRCFKLRRMSNPVVSPFLGLPSAERPCADEVAFAIFDCHPVSPEHGPVIAKLVVPRFFGCSWKRQGWHVRKEKRLLDEWLNRKPDGYNVDFDSGSAAGRTPPNVNAIPRYSDNMPDPHRGLRRVIPPKRSYLAQPSAGGERTPLMSLATFLGGRGCRSGRQRQTGSICLSRLCNVQGPNRTVKCFGPSPPEQGSAVASVALSASCRRVRYGCPGSVGHSQPPMNTELDALRNGPVMRLLTVKP